MNDHGIATADFRAIDDASGLRLAMSDFGNRGVLKTRRFGYDGKGQVVFSGTPHADAEQALTELGGRDCILESLVPFESEFSVIGARAADGTVRCYDPSENIHRDGILRTSTVPALLPEAAIDQATAVVETILSALDYIGVIGVEFFLCSNDKVLVNEIAPRVHNSGHWTEAACMTSQFEQHVRAVCGWPLASTSRHSNAEMHNLVGHDVDEAGQILAEPATVLHLYGKAETRAGRKMGHFTRLTPLSHRR
jgi:5-(carboxyamino)imidazole ribonucleotide synthase